MQKKKKNPSLLTIPRFHKCIYFFITELNSMVILRLVKIVILICYFEELNFLETNLQKKIWATRARESNKASKTRGIPEVTKNFELKMNVK